MRRSAPPGRAVERKRRIRNRAACLPEVEAADYSSVQGSLGALFAIGVGNDRYSGGGAVFGIPRTDLVAQQCAVEARRGVTPRDYRVGDRSPQSPVASSHTTSPGPRAVGELILLLAL